MKIRSASELKNWASHKWQKVTVRWKEVSLGKSGGLADVTLLLTSTMLIIWLVLVMLPVILILAAIGTLVAVFSNRAKWGQTSERSPIDCVAQRIYEESARPPGTLTHP